jgi:hypothetical protein
MGSDQPAYDTAADVSGHGAARREKERERERDRERERKREREREREISGRTCGLVAVIRALHSKRHALVAKFVRTRIRAALLRRVSAERLRLLIRLVTLLRQPDARRRKHRRAIEAVRGRFMPHAVFLKLGVC